ncbi:serine protease inhibitor 77Ba-like [Danaus plexippus]|uniref:serine protease inhibitor 77Ba-like n=1 Tax=Danaus plexippus TaxID=13037 RepID=UPI002AB30DD6|nr:serine protease inhibitor 77Ba-like [Danaus plexippus]
MIGSILLSILFVAASESLDYTATARNFSIELVYFTQTKTDHEVVLAPFGLWSLMGQVAFAANGPTRYELQRTLISNASNEDNYFNNLDKLMSRLKEPSDGVEMIIKNFLFRDQSLKVPLDFVTRVEQTKGNIWSLDFTDVTAPRLLNTIIKSNTKFPIPVFGPNDFNETDLIFSNVFSFKGKWSTPFNRSNTYVQTSLDAAGNALGLIDIMSQDMKVPSSDIKELKATVTELSFGTDGKYCMLIIKPYQGVTVTEVYKQLASVTLKNIFDQLQRDFNDVGIKNINVKLPRFEKQSFLVLNAPLNDMGTYSIFDPDKAQLSGLSEEPLYVETIEQRARIFVTEEGVDAYATIPANLEIATRTNPNYAKPFIFFIVHKSTVTILMGGTYGKS